MAFCVSLVSIDVVVAIEFLLTERPPNQSIWQHRECSAKCRLRTFIHFRAGYLASPHHRWYTYSSPTEKNPKQSLGASVTEHKRGAPPICRGANSMLNQISE